MKKLIIATALIGAIGAIGAAQAVELGVSAVRDYQADANGVRVTLGNYDLVGFKTALEVTSVRRNGIGYEQYVVSATREVYTLGPVAFAGKVSTGYVNRTTGLENGYVLNLGVGATYKLAKNTDAVVGFERRFGQDRVSDLDGNTLTIGLKQSF